MAPAAALQVSRDSKRTKPSVSRRVGDALSIAGMQGLLSGGRTQLAEPLEASLPLGLGHLDPAVRKEHTAPFGPGDRILFYTDGISEARDKSGAFYPVDRCGALLGGAEPRAALDRLYDDVLRHVGGHLQDDSAALLVLRRAALQAPSPGTVPTGRR